MLKQYNLPFSSKFLSLFLSSSFSASFSSLWRSAPWEILRTLLTIQRSFSLVPSAFLGEFQQALSKLIYPIYWVTCYSAAAVSTSIPSVKLSIFIICLLSPLYCGKGWNQLFTPLTAWCVHLLKILNELFSLPLILPDARCALKISKAFHKGCIFVPLLFLYTDPQSYLFFFTIFYFCKGPWRALNASLAAC